MLHNTEYWSAGAFISALDSDKQDALYKKNSLSLMLKYTESWSVGDFIPVQQDQQDDI